ncbi:MAG: Twin-arginine translocation protein TatB [uncultured Sphingomonadaceae bacterium]|uniref:Twin-arginine translocation protein TatB n=1 Tax=uncultured Sphingomonadaceae bacterium TaxID=169976 RepID=A0A6J4TEA8_9SPHN|nr:MAG: Twin-arginine translocation protein TatB [uncultured Sphingomonadaceae bacterium]
MFDVALPELLLVALVALLVIGPKDLPRVLYKVGQWLARARGVARHFRSGLDDMVRQAELEDMEKQWAKHNADIMREHPNPPRAVEVGPADPDAPAEPAPPAPPPSAP